MMTPQIKQVLISIAIGAVTAFCSTLFQGLADFFKSHSTAIVSGSLTAFAHLINTYKA